MSLAISLPPHPLLTKTSFLPSTIAISSRRTPPPVSTARSNILTTTTTVRSSSVPIKLVRYPALDRRASKHSRLRFVRKLTTLLLSKPRHFLPLHILSRCRSYLSPPPSRSLLHLILRYPSLFRLFYTPSFSSRSLSALCVSLTPSAAALAARDSALRKSLDHSLAAKLHRLLHLAGPHHRLLLSKLAHIAPDLGLPPNFRSRLCNSHPQRFRTVDTSFGRALELVSFSTDLTIPFPRVNNEEIDRPFIIDRAPKFKQLKLRRGLNLKHGHRDYLLRLQDLPEVDPYGDRPEKVELAEKRACAVVREVLAMTVEKRTLVDHITHFRKEFRLPNKLRGMLVRHPEMFYVSVKGERDTVFLVEAYDDKGKLLVQDELLSTKQSLAELIWEGKRMRRERRMSTAYDDRDNSDDREEEEEEEQEEEDKLDELLDAGIGDDWEELDIGNLEDMGGEDSFSSFWVQKVVAECNACEGLPEAW